jgi:hypothetical protein
MLPPIRYRGSNIADQSTGCNGALVLTQTIEATSMDRATSFDTTTAPVILNFVVALALALGGTFVIACLV